MITTVLSAFGVGMAGGAATYWGIYESRVNRVEDMKVAEYKTLMDDHREFLEALNGFTQELATKGTVDKEKMNAMSAMLVRQHIDVGAFKVNIPREKEQPLRDLQTSINEVKKRLQLVESKEDLDPLGLSLVKFFESMNTVRPILEEAVGKPTNTTG